MIAYVTSADHAYTVESYLNQWVPPGEGYFIQVVFYEETPWRWLHLPACYIFTDIERLSPGEIAASSDYARKLQAQGCRVLNVPDAVARRVEFQDRLFRAGINPFRHWPRDAFQRSRFPAFLRRADLHAGSIGDLIYDAKELTERLASLPAAERSAEDLILVEFCDTRDSAGRYSKYSAMQVGDEMLPRHVFTSRNWMLKYPDILDSQALELERDFVRRFPHRERVRKVFSLAGIDYGRIDYAMHGEELRVWEINTNPTLMPSRKTLAMSRRELMEETNRMFLQALRALDAAFAEVPRAEWGVVRARHARFAFLHRCKRRLLGGKRP
jgi:hypothetical protein